MEGESTQKTPEDDATKEKDVRSQEVEEDDAVNQAIEINYQKHPHTFDMKENADEIGKKIIISLKNCNYLQKPG